MGQRLIDANAVVRAISEEKHAIPVTVPAASYELVPEKPYKHGEAMRGGIRKALRCIEQAPTVEAVSVIRCRECKHAWIHPCGYVLCHRDGRSSYEMVFNLDSFCSFGKRKEGAE